MATQFKCKAFLAASLGIVLSSLLATTTPTSAACGNTAGSLEPDPTENPFAGSWSGTWSEPGVVGTHDWTISDEGRITGRIYNITYNIGGAMVGHVDPDGNLVAIFLTPGAVPSISGFPFQGTAVIDGEDHLVASCTGMYPGGPLMVSTLERN